MAEATETAEARASESQDLSRLSRLVVDFNENRFAYYMILPTVMYLMLLVWYPWIQGLVMSLYDWPLFGPKTFIGIENYIDILTWDIFHQSVISTVIYSTQTIGHMILGTAMALIVWRQKRFAGVISVIFLIPYVIPPLVSGTLFRYLLDPNIGPFFKFMIDIGILNQPIYWLTNGDMAMAAITLIGVWTWSPLVFLLVIASLEGIPEEYYELARIYGTSSWERFRYITFPQIKTTLLIALIIRIIWNLGKVSQPFQITRGGPGHATSVLGVLLYRQAWNQGAFGTAFAIGIVLSAISIVFIAGFVYLFETQETEVSMA